MVPSDNNLGEASARPLPDLQKYVHVHTVQPADTLISIAAQYDVPVSLLIHKNKLASSDIWFHRYILVPCWVPESKAESISLPKLVAASHELEDGGQWRPREPLPIKVSASGEVRALECSPERWSTNRTPVLSETMHRVARVAMLIEAIVRESGVHPELARSRIGARRNDFQAALEDCLRLRHWEAELNVTVPEILAFLAFHNEQLDPAYRAIVENNRWKKDYIEKLKRRRTAATFGVLHRAWRKSPSRNCGSVTELVEMERRNFLQPCAAVIGRQEHSHFSNMHVVSLEPESFSQDPLVRVFTSTAVQGIRERRSDILLGFSVKDIEMQRL